MMTILILTGGFFPGQAFGGPSVSVDNFCSLMREFECYIVTSDHDLGEKERYKTIEDGWNDRVNAKVLYLTDKEYHSLKKVNELVKEVKPDWIYLQSLFQDISLLGLIAAKKNNIKVLLAPRGELCTGAFKKKYKKIPYILGLRLTGLINHIYFQSTSDEETEAIRTYFHVPYGRIHNLTNIPSIPRRSYVRREKEAGKGRLIFLSRIHPKKNLKYAIECFDSIEGDVEFDIYGPMEDKQYWNDCLTSIRQLPHNVKVKYCGLLPHEEVHNAFSRYDAFIFPTLSENYGHVIAESLMVGTPVIISDQTPWNDVNRYNCGWAISLNEKNRYRDSIQQIISLDNKEMTVISDNAKRMCEDMLGVNDIHDAYLKVF